LSSDERNRAAAFQQIRQFGDPVLKEESRTVEPGEDLRELVERMIKVMHAADGVGLAAPQIGVLRQVIVFLLDDEEHILLNPRITWRSEETVTDAEGCLSLMNHACEVERAEKIKVEGEDLDGNKREYELEGLHARILQHEIDHLQGQMVINRTSRDERKNLLSRMRKDSMPEGG
jgi:peptide deformylase